jgi:hypothetical protein
MASLLKKYDDASKSANFDSYTSQARTWFTKNVASLTRVNRQALLRDDKAISRSRFLGGRLYQFVYDPKTKDTLLYYDKFPLSIMLEKAEGGFYGLNLHYLRPRTRAIFLSKLTEFTNNKKFDETTRFQLSYNLIKAATKLKEFKPCFKHYLKNHVRSKMIEIPAQYWEVAIFLPTENFAKAAKTTVYSLSQREI